VLDGGRLELGAAALEVTFDAIPAHTRGVGTYGADEVPRQERPTRYILHTVFEARQLHIRGIPFLDERFRSHRSDAARI
jgi:hypothetical protein